MQPHWMKISGSEKCGGVVFSPLFLPGVLIMNAKTKEMSENVRTRWENRGNIPVWRVMLIAEMAEKEIYPEGSFGDDECIYHKDREAM